MSTTTTPPAAPAIWTPPPGWSPPPGAGWPPPPPGTWPARPTAVPPSCFSQLYALNQCYDDIQMMEKILTKVITNLIQTDPALVASIVAAIAASGSNVPLIGVTNGADAQPGQVGQWVQFEANIPFPVGQQQTAVSLGVLQPGDWDVWAWSNLTAPMSYAQFWLSPVPPGFSSDVSGWVTGNADENAKVIAPVGRALISEPSVIAYQFLTSGATVASTAVFYFLARRCR